MTVMLHNGGFDAAQMAQENARERALYVCDPSRTQTDGRQTVLKDDGTSLILTIQSRGLTIVIE